jgi:hypothetical protein
MASESGQQMQKGKSNVCGADKKPRSKLSAARSSSKNMVLKIGETGFQLHVSRRKRPHASEGENQARI